MYMQVATRQLYYRVRVIAILLFLFSFSLSTSFAAKPAHLIKFASIAPEGTSWATIMRAMDEEVRVATNNQVGFKFYLGGVQGDEPDVLRKMRFGQLHAAGFTGVGIGEILPSMRILELPFLFKTKDEVDFILDKFTDYYDSEFRKKGYVLLGWTEVGSVYFYSNIPLTSSEDIRNSKLWAWQGDPLASALVDAFGVTPVLLSVPEVLTAMQTGMINTLYCAPMAAVSMQWFTRVKYMYPEPITNSMGAVLLSKKLFDKIPAEHQETLLNISRNKLKELTEITRNDNKVSIEEMKKSGIQLSQFPSDTEMKEYSDIGEKVKNELIGSLYSAELLAEVEKALEDYRNGIKE